MFCDRCGTRLSDPANFCPTCGKTARTTPLMPVQSRIAGHVRLLGIFWLALLPPAQLIDLRERPFRSPDLSGRLKD